MVGQVLPLEYLERLMFTLVVVVVAVILLLLAVQAVQAEVGVAVMQTVFPELVEPPILVAVAAARQKALAI
jgi:uncharacterized metal-binding protein